MKQEIERKNTQKKQKLIKLISENLGIEGFTKSMYEMMLEAGYAESSAKQQTAILTGIKEELKPLANQLEGLRIKAIEELEKNKNKFKTANLRDLVSSIDTLTKNIQLISGKPTERTEAKEITGFVIIKPNEISKKQTNS